MGEEGGEKIVSEILRNKTEVTPLGSSLTLTLGSRVKDSLVPSSSLHVRERGSGILNYFSCHSSRIRELKSDCRTSSSTRSSMPAVQCTCMGNAFFTPFDPTPCDKKCRSEHQTLFPLFRRGLGTRLGEGVGRR